MKKAFLLCCLASLCAASASAGNGKVNKEKTSKLGIMFKAGTNNFSMSKVGFDGGMYYGGYVTYGFPINPRNPECRWALETGFGLDFMSGKASYIDRGRYRDDIDDDAYLMNMTIPCTVKYILNPLGSRGKWNVNAGVECSLGIGVPTLEEDDDKYLKSGSFGIGAGINAGIGYEARHWGFSVGGRAGYYSSFDTEAYCYDPASVGVYGALKYFF